MDEINTRVRRSLEFYKDVDLMDSLDWAVQEDKAYEGASKDEIRRYALAYYCALLWSANRTDTFVVSETKFLVMSVTCGRGIASPWTRHH